MNNDPNCIVCEAGTRCEGFCKRAAVFQAADAMNKANVREASNVGTRNGLYRSNMSPEARKLDEAFQAYYEAQQPRTIHAADIGFTLKSDQATLDAIADDVARKAPPRSMR